MKLIMSQQCEALTGSLGRGFGYHIEHRKHGFYGIRDAKGIIPPAGHWLFIVACAEIAKAKLHIVDISVSRDELKQALYEARCFIAMQNLNKEIFDARDIINLKTTFSL